MTKPVCPPPDQPEPDRPLIPEQPPILPDLPPVLPEPKPVIPDPKPVIPDPGPAEPEASYRPAFTPTGQSNRRSAQCARCKSSLPAGAGFQWDWSDFVYAYVINARPHYYCHACHNHLLALQAIEPELRAALARIEKWCRTHVTQSMWRHAYDHTADTLRRAGLRAPEAARALIAWLPYLEAPSYGALVGLARSIVSSCA